MQQYERNSNAVDELVELCNDKHIMWGIQMVDFLNLTAKYSAMSMFEIQWMPLPIQLRWQHGEGRWRVLIRREASGPQFEYWVELGGLAGFVMHEANL